MKKCGNIHIHTKASTTLIIIYVISLALIPLFHVHPDKDHHDIKGSNYHSHHIPFDSDDADEEIPQNRHEAPVDFFLESLNLLHLPRVISQSNDRVSSKTAPILVVQSIFKSVYLLHRIHCKPLQNIYRQALFNPQKESFVLLFANTSPPLT